MTQRSRHQAACGNAQPVDSAQIRILIVRPSQSHSLLGARTATHDPFGSTIAIEGLGWEVVRGTLGLSPRESEIVRLLFDGQKEFAIALAMGVSPHTVHTHIGRLYRKLYIRDRIDLIKRILAVCLAYEEPGRSARLHVSSPLTNSANERSG